MSEPPDFARAIGHIRYWFACRNMPCESLTVIFNFSDAREAAAFDAEIKRCTEPMLWPKGGVLDITAFELYGVKVRVESPVHTP